MAVKALQAAGYFEIRKVGRCNRYRPRFAEQQVQNLHLSDAQQVQSLHLSEGDRCKKRPEQVQKPSANRCKKGPPTSLENSLGASARATLAGAPDGAGGAPLPIAEAGADGEGLGRAGAALRQRIGADLYQSWFADVAFVSLEDGVLTLATPTAFKRTWIEQHHATAIAAAWAAAGTPFERLALIVRSRSGIDPAAVAGAGNGQARWLLDVGRHTVALRMQISGDRAQHQIIGWMRDCGNDAATVAQAIAAADDQQLAGEKFRDVVAQRIRAAANSAQRSLPLPPVGLQRRRAHG
jgi:hypothetical protein